MASTPVLGPVVFENFEIPEQISFGGRQKLVIHALPGGGRIVDAMGADDAPIRWSGVFSGPAAASRVRMLERFRRIGTPLLLAWDSWRFYTIIEMLEVEASNPSWIPYSIELCVVPDPGTALVDWLVGAVSPSLSIATIGGSALQAAIARDGAALGGSDLGVVLGASGRLAQHVTMWAYSGAGR